jgi:hypothetical protein
LGKKGLIHTFKKENKIVSEKYDSLVNENDKIINTNGCGGLNSFYYR